MHLGGQRKLLIPLLNLHRILIEERTLGTTAAVHYFGLLGVGSHWQSYFLRYRDRSETVANSKSAGTSCGAVLGGGAQLSFEKVSDRLGPLSEAEPECDTEDEKGRDDEHANEVGTSEIGCMGNAGRW